MLGRATLLSSHGNSLEGVQGRADGVLVPEDTEKDPPLEPERQDGEALVAHEAGDGDGEDPVELLEGALHGLGDPEEDHDEGDDVETGVHAEGADGLGLLEQEWEGHGEDGGPAQTGGDGEGHAGLAVGQGKDLGGVGEGDRALTGGVEGAEEEDEQAHEAGTDAAGLRGVGDERAESRGEKGPEHLREGEEQEGATTESVDGPEGREGEEPVDHAETKGTDHGDEVAHAGLGEDGGGVEGDDVDAAHLLGQHDGEGGEGGAAHTRHGEELLEALGVVGLADDLVLDLELRADVVDVARDLDLVVAELQHGVPGLRVPALLHVPTGGLGAEVDEAEKRHGGQEGSAQHIPPVVRHVEDGEVESSSQHDTEGSPHFWPPVSFESNEYQTFRRTYAMT